MIIYRLLSFHALPMKPEAMVSKFIQTLVYQQTPSGRFLLGILRDIAPWYQDMKVYIQENKDKKGAILPGFKRGRNEKKVLDQEDLHPWEDFKRLLNKWHKKLAAVSSFFFVTFRGSQVVYRTWSPVSPLMSICTSIMQS